jgi:hypothetical protein
VFKSLASLKQRHIKFHIGRNAGFASCAFIIYHLFLALAIRKAYEKLTNNHIPNQNVNTSSGTKKSPAQIVQQTDAMAKKRR